MIFRLFFLFILLPNFLFGMKQNDPKATIPVASSSSSQSVHSSVSSAPASSTRSISSPTPTPSPAPDSSSKRSSLGAIFRAVGFASRPDSPGKKARKDQAAVAASCCGVDALGSDSDFALHLDKNMEKLSPEQRQLVQTRMQELSVRNSAKP